MPAVPIPDPNDPPPVVTRREPHEITCGTVAGGTPREKVAQKIELSDGATWVMFQALLTISQRHVCSADDAIAMKAIASQALMRVTEPG